MGIYKREGSPYWHYSFKLEGMAQVKGSTGIADKKLAEAKYQKIRGIAFESKTFGKAAAPDMTVLELLEYANKEKWHFKKLSWELDAVISSLGEIKASELPRQTVKNFRNERSLQVQKDSVNKEIALLCSAYNMAIDSGLLIVNPVAKIEKFKCKDRRRRKYLTPQEKTILVNAAQGLLQDLVVFALQTGMRLGEIRALKWQDIDWPNMQIKVISIKGGEMIVRDVPIWDQAHRVILVQPKRCEFVFSYDRCTGHGPDDKACLSEYCCAHSTYPKLIDKLGIKGGDFRFHDLRHTFASDFLMAGNSLAELAEIMGHQKFDTTRRYAHLSREHQKAGMARMPRLVYQRSGSSMAEHLLDMQEAVGSSPTPSSLGTIVEQSEVSPSTR